MYMIFDCFVVSVIFLIIFLALGYDLETTEIIKQFMPTYMEANWFISCYCLFYMIHPMLNTVIESLNKEKLLVTNICAIFIYCGLQFVRPGSMHYSKLIGFICIYFIVAYTTKYLKSVENSVKANIIILALSLSLNFMLIVITNFLGLHSNLFSTQLTRWRSFTNPFLILTALTMFFLAKKKQFVKPIINYISGLSMLVYIIHYNKLIIYYLISDIYLYIYNIFSYKYELFWVSLVAIILLFTAVFMGIVYKYSIQKLSHKICDWTYEFVKPTSDLILNKILRFE